MMSDILIQIIEIQTVSETFDMNSILT
jgi:hypothetical protein